MALWRVFVVPEEPAVPWQRALGLIDRLRGSPALEEGVYPNTGYLFSFPCCLSPLPSASAMSFPAGKRGEAAADRAGGQRSCWYTLVQGTSLGLTCAGASRRPGLGCGVSAAGLDTAQCSSSWEDAVEPTPSLRSVLVFNRDGSFPAGLSLRHTRVKVLLEPPGSGNSQRLCWRAWAPTGRTGVGTASRAVPCYPSPAGARAAAWGRKWSLGGGLGSDLGWAGGEKERQSPGGSPVPPSPPPHGIYPAGAWLCCEQSHLPS